MQSIAKEIKSLEANGKGICFILLRGGKPSRDLKGIEFDKRRRGINRLIIKLTNYPVSASTRYAVSGKKDDRISGI